MADVDEAALLARLGHTCNAACRGGEHCALLYGDGTDQAVAWLSVRVHLARLWPEVRPARLERAREAAPCSVASARGRWTDARPDLPPLDDSATAWLLFFRMAPEPGGCR